MAIKSAINTNDMQVWQKTITWAIICKTQFPDFFNGGLEKSLARQED